MKRLSVFFGVSAICVFLMGLSNLALGQEKVRPSLHASVTQRLGVGTDVTIDYSRPGVKGRKIWGELVPYGLTPGNNYSENKPFPWRAGANECTTIEFSKDVMIEGKKVPAGKYSIHMVPSESTWKIMFNTDNTLWGSYKYDKSKDVLEITVTPQKAAHQEWLAFGFEDLAGTSATAYLHWAELKVPFKIAAAE